MIAVAAVSQAEDSTGLLREAKFESPREHLGCRCERGTEVAPPGAHKFTGLSRHLHRWTLGRRERHEWTPTAAGLVGTGHNLEPPIEPDTFGLG